MNRMIFRNVINHFKSLLKPEELSKYPTIFAASSKIFTEASAQLVTEPCKF